MYQRNDLKYLYCDDVFGKKITPLKMFIHLIFRYVDSKSASMYFLLCNDVKHKILISGVEEVQEFKKEISRLKFKTDISYVFELETLKNKSIEPLIEKKFYNYFEHHYKEVTTNNEIISIGLENLPTMFLTEEDLLNKIISFVEDGKKKKFKKNIKDLVTYGVYFQLEPWMKVINREPKINSIEENITKEKEPKKYCEIGSLFAQGFIKKEKEEFYYKIKTFKTLTQLCIYLNNEVLKKEVENIRQYIGSTLNETANHQNFYSAKALIKNVWNYCITNNLKISEHYQSIYDNIDI